MRPGFRKSISLGKVRVNLGKKSIGISAGVKGARVGISTQGTYSNVSIPGTGIYKRTYHKKNNARSQHPFGFWFYLIIFILLGSWAVQSFISFICFFIPALLIYLVIHLNSNNLVNKKIEKSAKLQIDGKNNESRLLLSKVIRKHPENYQANILMGLAYFHDGLYTESLPYLENIKIDTIEHENMVNIILSKVYMNLGDYKTPIQLLQGISTDNNDLEVIYLLGLCFFENCSYDLAINTLKEAPLLKRKMPPILLEIHYLLGQVYKDMGDVKKSKRHLDRVYAKDITYSGNPSILTRFWNAGYFEQ